MITLIYLTLGFLTSLLFPPYFFLPLGFIIFPSLCLLLDLNRKNNINLNIFKNFSLFGFGFFVSYLFWVKNPFFVFEETKNFFLVFLLLIILLSLILSLIFTIISKLGKNIPVFFLIPFMFTITEYIISVIFYGFPWFTFSLVISSNEYLLFSLKSFGTLISSYLIIQIFCLPFIFITKVNLKKEMIYFSLFIILPIIFSLISNAYFQNNNLKTKTIDLEIFQLNFKNNDKSLTSEKKLNIIINNIQKSTADLIIFGENNFPYLLEDLDLKILKDSLKENQVLIIGATRFDNNKYYNSLISITTSKINYFDKKILVPFGEFLPLRDSLNFLERIVGPNNFSNGNEQRLINLPNNISFIPVICYEIVFYWKLINKLNYNSNFIINITNDFWFGKYIGPYQHLYLTKIRAAEFNKPIIRVSNNGISAVIDNKGSIIKKTKLNNSEKFKHKLYLQENINFVNLHLILKIYFSIIFLLITFYYLRKNV
ncbi:apolipoprotein N-acyltransferase [Pelagibacteraceae bacterium]|nr:apolipoprotein N-acyltransferase [Pelagibacteraceae bacterium]